ncbi:lipid asymmetry maintenance protein MlaB [Chitinimonas sp. BJB300]|uniref:STAS domain-containing protein n=1 Tax=Chitinimonas sp. BJB300 TaxID=1559339 RepID=UPI00130447A2|nr:STAS domain-containing protein [Chitinimonas sp. BJB300]
MTAVITLTGGLVLDSICRIEREFADQLRQSTLVVDLAGVSEVDSTAISLLLQWRRAAAAAGRQLQFRQPPASLLSLATLYGVEEFLQFSND